MSIQHLKRLFRIQVDISRLRKQIGQIYIVENLQYQILTS